MIASFNQLRRKSPLIFWTITLSMCFAVILIMVLWFGLVHNQNQRADELAMRAFQNCQRQNFLIDQTNAERADIANILKLSISVQSKLPPPPNVTPEQLQQGLGLYTDLIKRDEVPVPHFDCNAIAGNQK